ncbi:MAG: hypothetical protein IH940_01175 [Acidobacteria bacterium]|nr:hypothetical protein [Acidobacteriota bacterium]
MVEIRSYDADRDLKSVARIWREVGWIDESEAQAAGLSVFLEGGQSRVAIVDGSAECAVHRGEGLIRYLYEDLDLCVISAVVVSRIARRIGVATSMTAQAVTSGAKQGAEVAFLGMFEQGFYDRLGFGSGGYEHKLTFDPATLTVPIPDRIPVRISTDQALEVHDLMARRTRGHGGIVVSEPQALAAEMACLESPVALGYRNEDGRLTHALLGESKNAKSVNITHLLAEEPNQLLELLGLIRAQSDQWASVRIPEPPELQVQDLIRHPIRQRSARELAGSGVPFESIAWWQARILDLPKCVARWRGPVEPLVFALELHDPLSDRDDVDWDGLSDEWTITIGAESSAVRGLARSDLPLMRSGVGAFTRLWLGVRSASVLARSTDLDAPQELLEALDRAICLPRPQPGIEF